MFKFLMGLARSRKVTASKSRKAPSTGKTALARPPSVRKDKSSASRPQFLDPLPIPEVKESHDESAWDEWEHSSMEIDSRMGGLSAYDSVKVKDAVSSQLGELDPFASVRNKKRT